MTCPLSPLRWWQDYVAGRLRTPQSIYRAAQAENPDAAQSADRVFDIPDPGPGFMAPARLQAPQHMKSESYMGQIRRADWSHTDPRLIVWAATFQRLAAKRGVPLYVHCALRPKSVQDQLLKQGRTKAAYPRSAHNIGEAVDIVHGTFHWQMNEQEWQYIAVLGRLALDRVNARLKKANKLALSWGGDWSFYDPAHWEISDYRSRIRSLKEPAQKRPITPLEALRDAETFLHGL